MSITSQQEGLAAFPDPKEIRTRARLALLGRYTNVIFATLCAELIIWGLTALFTFSGRTRLSLVISLMSTFILSVLAILLGGGFSYIHLQITREHPVKVGDLFYCFRHHADSAIKLALLLALTDAAASLPYLALDLLLPVSGSGVLTELALVLAWIVPFAAVNLFYCMAFYLYLEEPSLSPLALMQKSRSLTRGYRLRLAGLVLSFFGYALLGILSLGVGFLWIGPYFQMSVTQFYLELRRREASEH